MNGVAVMSLPRLAALQAVLLFGRGLMTHSGLAGPGGVPEQPDKGFPRLLFNYPCPGFRQILKHWPNRRLVGRQIAQGPGIKKLLVVPFLQLGSADK